MLDSEKRVFDSRRGDVSTNTFAIVVSRYHETLTSRLLDGALSTLHGAGVDQSRIGIAHVPGAWELGVAAAKLIEQYDAVICLGIVIKGDTTHDQFINSSVSHSLSQLAIEHRKPVGFGLLTCNTLEQAVERCGGRVGNKGEEAALAALEMVQLLKQL